MAEIVQKVLRPPRVPREEILSTIERAKFVVIAGAGLTGDAAKKYFEGRGLKTFIVVDALPNNANPEIHLFSEVKDEIKSLEGVGFSLFSPGISPSGSLAQSIFSLGLPSISELDQRCCS